MEATKNSNNNGSARETAKGLRYMLEKYDSELKNIKRTQEFTMEELKNVNMRTALQDASLRGNQKVISQKVSNLNDKLDDLSTKIDGVDEQRQLSAKDINDVLQRTGETLNGMPTTKGIYAYLSILFAILVALVTLITFILSSGWKTQNTSNTKPSSNSQQAPK